MSNLVPLLAGGVVLLLVGMLFWLRQRTAKLHADALAREERALEALSLLRDSRLVPPHIEQAVEVFDVDALLGGKTLPHAAHLSDALDRAPGLHAPDTLEPFGAPAHARAVPTVARVVPPPARTAPGAARAMARSSAPAAVAAAAPAVATGQVRIAPMLAPGPSDDVLRSGLASAAGAIHPATLAAGVPPGNRAVPQSGQPALGSGVPLRELALVWFEARGYAASPASQALWPIELVLRHRDDPARAYAFVALATPLTAASGLDLIQQAHSIGLARLLIAAEAGAGDGVARDLRRRGSRVMDRAEMQKVLQKLDFRVAARIIGVARTRADGRATVP